MIDPAELGQRIQERRKQQGLTQEQLGSDLFVSPQAVSKWENGERKELSSRQPRLNQASSRSVCEKSFPVQRSGSPASWAVA